MFFRRFIGRIPEAWLDQVSEILRRGDENEIEWSKDALERWQVYGKRGDAYPAMLKCLVPGVTGRFVEMPIDEGDTYAFFFNAAGEQMYGKICLKRDGSGAIVYSAHPKEREQL